MKLTVTHWQNEAPSQLIGQSWQSASSITLLTGALQFAWWLQAPLLSCPPVISCRTIYLASGHWQPAEIRRLSTHLTEDFITLQFVSEYVCVGMRGDSLWPVQ